MNPLDTTKTTFMSNKSNYYYKIMLFGIKGAGFTYQMFMDEVFSKQMGKNLDTYINDMVKKRCKTKVSEDIEVCIDGNDNNEEVEVLFLKE